jgi:hypothetical protein
MVVILPRCDYDTTYSLKTIQEGTIDDQKFSLKSD